MKRLYLFILFSFLFLLCSCSTAPEVIPDTTGDSVAMLRLKEELKQVGNPIDNKNWLWWYAPVALISMMWAVKRFFLTNCIEEDPDIITDNFKEQTNDKGSEQPAAADGEASKPE